MRQTLRQLAGSRRLDHFQALERRAHKFWSDQDDAARRKNALRSQVMKPFADDQMAPAQEYVSTLREYIGRSRITDRPLTVLNKKSHYKKLRQLLPLKTRRLDLFRQTLLAYRAAQRPVKIRKRVYRNTETTIVTSNSKRVVNKDLPDNPVFVDQGTAFRKNPAMDERVYDAANGNFAQKLQLVARQLPIRSRSLEEFSYVLDLYRDAQSELRRTVYRSRRQMNAAHMRELCYQSSGRNQALYMRQRPDIDKAGCATPEWLERHLDIEPADSLTLAQFLRRMRFKKPMIVRLVFGHMASDGGWRNGLKVLDRNELSELAADWERLADALPEIDDGLNQDKTLGDEREFYAQQSLDIDFNTVFDQIDYIESSAQQSMDIGGYVNPMDVDRMVEMGFQNSDEDVQQFPWCQAYHQWRDETYKDLSFDSNPYSSFALHYGEDAISWELTTEILDADMDHLKTIMGRYYETRTRTGWRIPAEYAHFTPQQRSSFWAYINHRRQQLAREYRKSLSDFTKQVIDILHREGLKRYSKALIMAYKNGKPFESDICYYEFDKMPRPSMTDMYVLWGEYRQMKDRVKGQNKDQTKNQEGR